ncbi:phage tail protein, partial [Shigella sonnei]|nr:phage tail protein [Shigella sonnei]
MTRTDLHRCYSPISFTVIRNTDKAFHMSFD